MIVDMQSEKLKKVKSKKICFGRTRCRKCGNFFVHESMWMVPVLGTNDARVKLYYCKGCAPTREAALKEAENDPFFFGIYDVYSI